MINTRLRLGPLNSDRDKIIAFQEIQNKINQIFAFAESGDLVSAAAVSWDDVTGKPSTFDPSEHNHDERYYRKTETYSAAEVDALLAGFGVTDDDSNFYTKTQVDTLLSEVALPAYGTDGGYVRSNGSAWVRVSGLAWADVTGRPTTLAGYGITDAYTKTVSDARFAAIVHTHAAADVISGTFADARIAVTNVTQHQAALAIAWTQLTGIPTTVAGYGITDVYTKTASDARFAAIVHTHAAADITSGTFADARIAASNVTQHQAALAIAWSQLTGVPTTVAGYGITDVYTKTASDARYAAIVHTHTTADITSGTFADARIAASNVTQHQAALAIAYSQLTGVVPTWNQNTSGSAATLTTPRAIWGQNFDGSGAITGAFSGVSTVTAGLLSVPAGLTGLIVRTNWISASGDTSDTQSRRGGFIALGHGAAAQFVAATYGGNSGTPTASTSAQNIGVYNFVGFDGTNWATGASVVGTTGEAWTTSGHGTVLKFSTTATGAVTAAATVGVFDGVGGFGIQSGSKLYFDGVALTAGALTGNTYAIESTGDTLDFVVGGSNPALRMVSGAVHIGLGDSGGAGNNGALNFWCGTAGLARMIFNPGAATNRGFIDYDAATKSFIMRADETTMFTFSSTQMGFFGHALASRQTYTVTNGTTNRSLNVTGATLAQLAQVVGTLITDVQSLGLAA